MTRGNQRERDRVRAENRNAQGQAKSQLDANAKALTLICAICRQQFMCTQSRSQLEGHVESKHAKLTFSACFPGYSG